MTIDLAALAKLAAEATPAPWEACVDDEFEPGHGSYVVSGSDIFAAFCGRTEDPCALADAAYIAAASPDVVAALVRVALAAKVITDRPGVWDAGGDAWWDAHEALRVALADLDR